MTAKSVTTQDILRVLESLPSDRLSEVWEFVEFLRFKAEGQSPSRRIIQLGGAWKGYPPILDADIAEARREMWGRFANGAV